MNYVTSTQWRNYASQRWWNKVINDIEMGIYMKYDFIFIMCFKTAYAVTIMIINLQIISNILILIEILMQPVIVFFYLLIYLNFLLINVQSN